MEIYFDEPRLKLTFLGRFLVRLTTYASYGFLTAAVLILLIFFHQEQPRLFWLGVLLSLFLIDRVSHFREADYVLKEAQGDQRVNLAHFLTPFGYSDLEYAYDKSRMVGGDFYLYLFRNLLGHKDVQGALVRLEINVEEVSRKTDLVLKKSIGSRFVKTELLRKVEDLMAEAYKEAQSIEEIFIQPRNILIVAIGQSRDLKSICDIFNLNAFDFREALLFSRHKSSFAGLTKAPAALGGFAYRHHRWQKQRIMNRAWTSRPTPTLDRYGLDLTALARTEQIGFLIGHQNEYRQLVDILSRPAKPNVLLLGETGSGKETLVAHLAFRVIKDDVPAMLFDRRLVELEISSLVAGASSEELSGRVKKIIDEVIAAGNIILYIPDIDNLVKTSGQAFLSAADMLLPEIKAGSFPVIGATYPREYKQHIESQSDFAGSFQVIRVEEISEADATRILILESLILEKQFKMFITFDAVRQSVSLAKKFFRNKLLPSSAEDLLKEALIEAGNRKEKVLKGQLVMEVVERQTKIPIQRAGEEEVQKLLALEEIIHRRLINQEEAVKSVSRSLREYRSGLSRRGGPIATFLFVGPTGVGKTELSKILTKVQFGAEELMVRFDMSEYQDKQSIFRFIGSPDGQTSGMLTEAIKNRPYGLVLLDEFEKAHPDILNLFLQVFDDGRLTDNLGQTVDFQNTVIIATSNAHSNFIKEETEKGTPVLKVAEELKKKLSDYFRPELLNRFSDIIVFRGLNLKEIGAVARLQLNELAKTLKENQGMDLIFSQEAIERIAELGYDPVFGARPLRKAISENIRSVLADKILRKEISRGSVIKALWENNNFEFKIEN